VESAISFILMGFRSLAEAGVEIPTDEDLTAT
jgi:hypothetical protein